MKRIALHLLLAALSLSCGMSAALLWKAHEEKAANRETVAQESIENTRPEVPVTALVIRPQAPLSISSITKKTARVFNVEVTNVSNKPIQNFQYLYAKTCSTQTEPSGGGVGFAPDKLMQPGEKRVFEAGVEDPVTPQTIQDCLDNATRIGLQINHVDFADGTAWDTD